MIPTWLTELFLDVKTISVPLASKIGMQESFVFLFLLNKYADCEFEFVDTFSSKYGIRDVNKIIIYLETKKLLSKQNGKIKLLTENLQELMTGEKEILQDNEYEKLIVEYIKMTKLKGRIFTRVKVLSMLEDFTVEQAKEALRYSIKMKFITPYKNEKNNGNSSGVRGSIPESNQSSITSRKDLSEEI